MEIRTKFDKKDRVTTIASVEVNQSVAEKDSFVSTNRVLRIWYINRINSIISSCSVIDGEIIYGLNEGGTVSEKEKEINCFPTKEEAQKECDKRNGKD